MLGNRNLKKYLPFGKMKIMQSLHYQNHSLTPSMMLTMHQMETVLIRIN